MRLFKTDKLFVTVSINSIEPKGTKQKVLVVKVGDAEAVTVTLDEPLVKAQVTDNALVRHILNFFIKE